MGPIDPAEIDERISSLELEWHYSNKAGDSERTLRVILNCELEGKHAKSLLDKIRSYFERHDDKFHHIAIVSGVPNWPAQAAESYRILCGLTGEPGT